MAGRWRGSRRRAAPRPARPAPACSTSRRMSRPQRAAPGEIGRNDHGAVRHRPARHHAKRVGERLEARGDVEELEAEHASAVEVHVHGPEPVRQAPARRVPSVRSASHSPRSNSGQSPRDVQAWLRGHRHRLRVEARRAALEIPAPVLALDEQQRRARCARNSMRTSVRAAARARRARPASAADRPAASRTAAARRSARPRRSVATSTRVRPAARRRRAARRGRRAASPPCRAMRIESGRPMNAGNGAVRRRGRCR